MYSHVNSRDMILYQFVGQTPKARFSVRRAADVELGILKTRKVDLGYFG
jgi:hypothetical protein